MLGPFKNFLNNLQKNAIGASIFGYVIAIPRACAEIDSSVCAEIFHLLSLQNITRHDFES